MFPPWVLFKGEPRKEAAGATSRLPLLADYPQSIFYGFKIANQKKPKVRPNPGPRLSLHFLIIRVHPCPNKSRKM